MLNACDNQRSGADREFRRKKLISDHGLFFPGLRAVAKKIRVFPSNGTGKRSRLCTVGWKRDEKAGR